MKRGEPGPIAKLTKDELIDLVDSSESVADAIRSLGLSHWGNYKTLERKCVREGVDITSLKDRGKAYSRSLIAGRGFECKYSIDEYLVENSPCKSRVWLKTKLIKHGLLQNACAVCDCGPEWRGDPLVLVLDHINGVNDDYRIENLRFLCPNCNSQTDTFAGRKRVHCAGCGARMKCGVPTGLCRSCSSRRIGLALTGTGKRPPKDELIALRQTMGREAVGKQFGVTGAAVKKWEKSYDLLGQLPDGRSFRDKK